MNTTNTPAANALATANAGAAIRRVAVIGAGTLGGRLAAICSAAGYSVILEDVLPSKLRSVAEAIDGAQALPAIAWDKASPAGAVEYALTIEEAVRDADLVIDCVPDELESKLEILSLIDRMAPPRTTIATPTRALSISDLASCIYRPERCLALQLLEDLRGDANKPPEVHIISIPQTDPAVLASVVSFWKTLGFAATAALEPTVAEAV
ncbi:MAG TPA: 3-hydroxyacyl-CoA dehydrogenase NAD-binding domain-containing protein [Acidisarcina sp.]